MLVSLVNIVVSFLSSSICWVLNPFELVRFDNGFLFMLHQISSSTLLKTATKWIGHFSWKIVLSWCLYFSFSVKGFSKMPKNISKRSFASFFDKGIIHQISYPHMLQLNFLYYQNARIDTLMLLELSCLICMYPNVFKVM